MFINFSLNFIDEMWSAVIDQLCKLNAVSDWILRIPCLTQSHREKLESYYKNLNNPIESLKGLSVLNMSVYEYISNLNDTDLITIMSDSNFLSMVNILT
jgi:hypothetical protein